MIIVEEVDTFHAARTVANVTVQLHTTTAKPKPFAISLSLSSVFCCRAGSGYPNGYPIHILMDILFWEIAEVVSLCLPRGL